AVRLVGGGGRSLGLFADEHELGILAGQPHFDVTARKLVVQLERRFRERVEQAQADRGLKREHQPPGRFGRRLVPQLRDRGEVGLERVYKSLYLHRDVTMTSLVVSVKRQPDKPSCLA